MGVVLLGLERHVEDEQLDEPLAQRLHIGAERAHPLLEERERLGDGARVRTGQRRLAEHREQGVAVVLREQQLELALRGVLAHIAQVPVAQLAGGKARQRLGVAEVARGGLEQQRPGGQALLAVDDERRRPPGDLVGLGLHVDDGTEEVGLDRVAGSRAHDVVPELGALALVPGVGPLVGGHDALGHRPQKGQEVGLVGAHGQCLRERTNRFSDRDGGGGNVQRVDGGRATETQRRHRAWMRASREAAGWRGSASRQRVSPGSEVAPGRRR